MNPTLRALLILVIPISTLFTTALAQQKPAKKNNLNHIINNPDGSITEFSRDPKNTTLDKRTYSKKANGERTLQSRILYRRDKNGKLRSGQIFDGKGVQLFRTISGYDKNTGRLVAENMYDAQVKHMDPNNPKKEQILCAFRYANQRSEPLIFKSRKDPASLKLLKWLEANKLNRGTLPKIDPFKKEPANPKLRPPNQ